MDEQIEKLREYIEESGSTVAVTGAGISVSSGGMTFSGSSSGAISEMTAIGSEEILRNDPDRYYRALDRSFLRSMFQSGPDRAHRALARLEREGKLSGIITTNVDCLHSIAGSEHVAEIQGSLQVNRCCVCGRQYNDWRIWSHGRVPECPECGGKIWAFPFYSHLGLYKEGVKLARELMSRAELVLVIGTNGFYSGSYWPSRRRKIKIVQINPGSTSFDSEAVLNIRRGADEVFSELFSGEDI